ncbi:MAG: hypothetical protein WAN35_07705 [Terracidiphilus sp.]
MASTTTIGFAVPVTAPAVQNASIHASRRRRITPEAGRALEILGHAIEYLTDEFVQDDRAFTVKNEQLQAVQMLMALNRQVYFECPEIPTLAERCRALLHLHSA